VHLEKARPRDELGSAQAADERDEPVVQLEAGLACELLELAGQVDQFAASPVGTSGEDKEAIRREQPSAAEEDLRKRRGEGRPTTPAAPRERRPCGVFAIESARSACAMPGASRSTTSRVASGVTSRGARPVPPVVRTRRAEAASSRTAVATCSRSSGTTLRSTS